MNKGILSLIGLLLYAGCQTAPQPEETETAEPVATEAPAMQRPDPMNPEGGEGAVPSGWQVRLDKHDAMTEIGADSESADIFFVNMAPGWHIRTGPAAIFYHPDNAANGSYEALMEVHLFNPGERREAFGMIFGGRNLDGVDQKYDYFLIRNSGEFLIKRRNGENTQVIQDWTASDAIVRYTNPDEPSVLNTLRVRVGESDVEFVINDQVVATHPKEHMDTDGIVGMRINHALNLHVSNLAVIE